MDMETVSETLESKLHFYKADEQENLHCYLVDLYSFLLWSSTHFQTPLVLRFKGDTGISHKPVHSNLTSFFIQ